MGFAMQTADRDGEWGFRLLNSRLHGSIVSTCQDWGRSPYKLLLHDETCQETLLTAGGGGGGIYGSMYIRARSRVFA